MNLYFIALIPPEEVREEIRHLKEEIRERFGAEHALKLPAHITLIPPFKLEKERELQLLQSLEVFAATKKPFHLWLSGFGNFPPRVLYVDVKENDMINNLHLDLRKNLSTFPEITYEKEFHPHVTLATRDLEESLFPAAKKFLATKDYETRFEVDSITLLKHKDREWERVLDFKFKKS